MEELIIAAIKLTPDLCHVISLHHYQAQSLTTLQIIKMTETENTTARASWSEIKELDVMLLDDAKLLCRILKHCVLTESAPPNFNFIER